MFLYLPTQALTPEYIYICGELETIFLTAEADKWDTHFESCDKNYGSFLDLKW